MIDGLLRFFHLFFAFSFVGSLIVADWNGRAARATTDWSQRALLFKIINLSSRVVGLGSLVFLGVLGNLMSVRMGYSMGADRWMWLVTALWIAALLVQALILLPNSGRLSALASAAASGGSSEGYERHLARWRFGNVLQSLLYLGLLAAMVFRWRAGVA